MGSKLEKCWRSLRGELLGGVGLALGVEGVQLALTGLYGTAALLGSLDGKQNDSRCITKAMVTLLVIGQMTDKQD